MEHWSILSNVINYVQYDRHPKTFHRLSVKDLDQKNQREMYNRLKDNKTQTLDIDFGNNPDKFRREY